MLVRRRRLLLWGNFFFFFGSICLWSLHVTSLSFALSHLVHAPCFLCPTAIAKRRTSSRWISSDTIFPLFNVDSLDHQRCGFRPKPAFPFATVPIISSIQRADSAFSIAIFAFHFHMLYYILYILYIYIYIYISHCSPTLPPNQSRWKNVLFCGKIHQIFSQEKMT